MLQQYWPWAMRAVWMTLPLTAGPLFAGALENRSTSFATAVEIGLWVVWGLTLLASLVPHTRTLTAIRIVMPAALPLGIWAAFAGDLDAAALVGIGFCAAAAMLVLGAPVGALFVDGTSYGDERRLPLRPPGPLLAGPIQLTWLVCAAGAVAGPLLLAAQRWVAGVPITIAGFAMALFAARGLASLADRWLVFVPAGVVLHDRSVLQEPVLFRREQIARVGPSWDASAATDLTHGSPGVALEVELKMPVTITRRAIGDAKPVDEDLERFLAMPTQPGQALTLAKARGFSVA